jgi:signal transduction histidine kinase/phage shock protein PspC (stress-responsive transcriptional regulator)
MTVPTLLDRTGLTRPEPVITGAASTLSARLDADVGVVRTAMLVLVPAGGVGLLVYGLAWLLLVLGQQPTPGRVAAPLRHNLGVVAGTAGVGLIVRDLVGGVSDGLVLSVGLVGFALALTRTGTVPQSGSLRPQVLRVAAGAVLMLGGLTAAAVGSTRSWQGLWTTFLATGVLTIGLMVVAAPFVQRLVGAADVERRQRIRAEERADLAAHLHDSVLQTLTLIQNRAADPKVTSALARQQERELRRWLYADDVAHAGAGFRDALEAAAAEIEDQYTVTIECVLVGEAPLDPRLQAVLAASREAMINAAKFAGTPLISVYAEVGNGQVEVNVRDRGVGFDPEAVPPDRRGIADSIVNRIDRVNGHTSIRTEIGAGTEVRIGVPVP